MTQTYLTAIFMLPKIQRLGKVEVEMVFKKGKSLSVRYFFIRSRKNYLNRSRFCIVFDKKISIKSHERILIRRRIYEATRKNISHANDIEKTTNKGKNLDVAYIVKPSLLKLPQKKIEPAVIEGLKTLGIMHRHG